MRRDEIVVLMRIFAGELKLRVDSGVTKGLSLAVKDLLSVFSNYEGILHQRCIV